MLSTFFGLETAQRALQAQQAALDVTGNNISNANTSGYTRQIVNLKTTDPLTVQGLGQAIQVGTGVTVGEITRTRDAFLDSQYRARSSQAGYWAERQDSLQQVEATLNEPSDSGLQSSLAQFWNAWSDLANNPESTAARTVVTERAIGLTDSLHNLAEQVSTTQQGLNDNVTAQIKQINVYAQQIAALNSGIARAEANGEQPNELYDQRDALVDNLAKLVNVKVSVSNDGSSPDQKLSHFTLYIGDQTAVPAQVLVDGTSTHLLNETPPGGQTFATVTWADGANAGDTDNWGNTVKLGNQSGSLLAAIEARGNATGDSGYLSAFMANIDSLASGIAVAVNSLHSQGQDLTGATGNNFFASGSGASITAATIELNPGIANDPAKIAAAAYDSSGVNSGDGSVASAISSLAEGWSTLPNGTAKPVDANSFATYYASVVAKIGADVQEATSMQSLQNSVVTQLANQRDSVSGVSLDEEMINLTKYQKSYAAAARVVTIMDSMLDTLMKMGVTG